MSPKKPFRFKLPKWGLKLLVGVSVGAALYTSVRLYLSKTHHESAKPNELQIRRDTSPSPAKVAMPPADTAAPVIPATAPPAIRQTKVNSDAGPKQKGSMTDSLNTSLVLNTPVHRDSALTPVEAAPLKPLRDSIAPAELKTTDIRKDTPNNNGKNPKKKKRPKVSVFF